DPAQQGAAHENAAAQSEQRRQTKRPVKCLADELRQLSVFLHVASDDQDEAAKAREVGARLVMALVVVGAGEIGKLDPAGGSGDPAGNATHVAGEPDAENVGEKVQPLVIATAALLDGVDEQPEAAAAILLGKPLDLRLYGGIDLPLEQAGRVPVDVGKNGTDRQREQDQVDCRQPEGGGA